MLTSKPVASVRRFHTLNLVVLGLPFAGTLVATWFFLKKDYQVLAVSSMALGFAIGMIGLVRQEKNLRRLECPSCHKILRRDPAKTKPGERISFLCHRCDTEWDSGFTRSTD